MSWFGSKAVGHTELNNTKETWLALLAVVVATVAVDETRIRKYIS